MPNTTLSRGGFTSPYSLDELEDMQGMVAPSLQDMLVVPPDMARDVERVTSQPGAVFDVPEGALRSVGGGWAEGGSTLTIPFTNGSNARIEETGEFIWTSENGDRIPISKLEDSHLTNIIKMLSRNMIGLKEETRQYQRNESTLILMRAERDKRNAQS